MLSSLDGGEDPPIVNIGSDTVCDVVLVVVVVPVTVRFPPTVILPVVVIASMKAFLNLAASVPKSTSLSVCGPKIPSDTKTCSAFAA